MSQSELPPLPHVAVILAAGRGQRMGGPKALVAVRWGDGAGELPLAIAHAKAHLDQGAERVVVVTRVEVARVLSRFAQRGLDIVVSHQPEHLGPAGSIRCALDLLPPSNEWLMVVPVDMPPISTAIRRELLSRASTDPAAAAIRPSFEGQRGHPVLIRRDALQSLLSEGGPANLRELLRDLGERAVDVPVIDKRAIVDLDAPEDVRGFYGRDARFFVEDEPTLS
jgi:molybdenum cofactor cytidylyltransferase